MKRQKYHYEIRGRDLLMSSVMILALVCTSVVVNAANQIRINLINGTEGVASVVEGRAEGGGNVSTTGFAHLQGYASHSRSRGLMVAGHRINFTRSTSVFPSVDGLSSGLRASQLSGRELTIFGVIGADGVDAVLVIVKPTAADINLNWSSAAQAGRDQWFEPSASDPRVGSAPSGSPE